MKKWFRLLFMLMTNMTLKMERNCMPISRNIFRNMSVFPPQIKSNISTMPIFKEHMFQETALSIGN